MIVILSLLFLINLEVNNLLVRIIVHDLDIICIYNYSIHEWMSKWKDHPMLPSKSEFFTGHWLEKEGIAVNMAFNTCQTIIAPILSHRMASCIVHYTVFQWEKNKSTEIIKFDSTNKENTIIWAVSEVKFSLSCTMKINNAKRRLRDKIWNN